MPHLIGLPKMEKLPTVVFYVHLVSGGGVWIMFTGERSSWLSARLLKYWFSREREPLKHWQSSGRYGHPQINPIRTFSADANPLENFCYPDVNRTSPPAIPHHICLFVVCASKIIVLFTAFPLHVFNYFSNYQLEQKRTAKIRSRRWETTSPKMSGALNNHKRILPPSFPETNRGECGSFWLMDLLNLHKVRCENDGPNLTLSVWEFRQQSIYPLNKLQMEQFGCARLMFIVIKTALFLLLWDLRATAYVILIYIRSRRGTSRPLSACSDFISRLMYDFLSSRAACHKCCSWAVFFNRRDSRTRWTGSLNS